MTCQPTTPTTPTVDGFTFDSTRVGRDSWIVPIDGTEYGLRRERVNDDGSVRWTVLELAVNHSTLHHYGTINHHSLTPDVNVCQFAHRSRLARLAAEQDEWLDSDG